MGNAYERQFHIFKAMDNNWENPGGFIKVEINGENTRFQLSLNNLSDKKDSSYNLYGIHKDKDLLTYTDICRIQPVNGRIDMKTNFPAEEIGSNKLNVHDINIFAVICQSTDTKSSGAVKCPLVAYTKEEQVWKEQLERLLEQPPVTKPDKTPEPKAEDTASYQAIPEEAQPEITLTEHDEVIDKTEEINIQPWTVIEEEECENYPETPEAQSESTEQEQEREDFGTNKDAEENNLSEKDAQISDLSSKFQGGLSSVYQSASEEEIEESDESNESDESYESEEIQNVLKRIQDDFNDISSIKIDETEEGEQQQEDIERSLNMQLLKQELDNSFEEYNPFRARNRSFRWWKINSPGFLNNILFRNNIKTYLLFNPKVMLAHYKYRYIILGIKNNRQPGREKLICGIPGVYNIDDNPFDSVGSWVQMEGFRPKYGAFGYWIVTLDPRTGKISKMK